WPVQTGRGIVGVTAPVTSCQSIVRGNKNLIGYAPGHVGQIAPETVREPKRSRIQSNVTERVSPADDLAHDVHAAGHMVHVDEVHQTRDVLHVLGNQGKDDAVGDVELHVRNGEESVKAFKGDRVC